MSSQCYAWHQKGVTRGPTEPSENVEPREPPKGMTMLRLCLLKVLVVPPGEIEHKPKEVKTIWNKVKEYS